MNQNRWPALSVIVVLVLLSGPAAAGPFPGPVEGDGREQSISGTIDPIRPVLPARPAAVPRDALNPAPAWSSPELDFTESLAWGDYDNDGDLDLLVVNLNDQPRLLRNDGGNRRHWLTVAAKLPGGKSDALGARIIVKNGPLVQVHDLIPVTGYLSQVDPRPHFGLGDAERVESIQIRWPDGSTTERNDVAADQILTVIQDAK